MKKQIIVVAGGVGSRMQSDVPKQFLSILGKAIILHTLEKIAQYIPVEEIILVLPEQEMNRWSSLAQGSAFEKIRTTKGGASRFQSVKNGLVLVDDEAIVGIHDSVRPLVSIETIKKAFDKAADKGSGIPSTKLKESIRRVFEGTSRAKDRTRFRLIQTPQCFNAKLLKEAYQQKESSQFTDDASVFEADGNPIYLVEGNSENIKITSPEDLIIAQALMA